MNKNTLPRVSDVLIVLGTAAVALLIAVYVLVGLFKWVTGGNEAPEPLRTERVSVENSDGSHTTRYTSPYGERVCTTTADNSTTVCESK